MAKSGRSSRVMTALTEFLRTWTSIPEDCEAFLKIPSIRNFRFLITSLHVSILIYIYMLLQFINFSLDNTIIRILKREREVRT